MTTSSPLPRTAPRLIGRDGEVARLETLLAGGGVLALVGEAGIGKSRLARHAVGMCEPAGRPTLGGHASALDGDLPLAAVRDALRSHLRSHPDATPAGDPLAAAFPRMVLPELRERTDDDPGRDVVFEAATRWVAATAGRSGLLLVLEDLHWADASTHALVLHLARARAAAPVAIVLTFRPDEAEPGSSLDVVRRELARERLAEEVTLSPLDATAVAALLEAIVGVELEPSLVELFVRTGGGNPFVTEELLRAAIEEGRLAPEDGAWRGPPSLRLPWTVNETLLARVARLPEPDRRLLGWAAVAGERFDPELVQAAAGLRDDALAQGLRRARAAGLVRDDDAGMMAFRHAITHEAVLGSLLAPERRLRHARLLAAAERLAAAGREVPLGLLVSHAEGAGDRPRAFAYARQAAARSLELGGDAEALGHIERALARWSEREGPASRAELLLEQGRLLHWVIQDHRRAVEPLGAAAAAFDALAEPDRATLARTLRAGARWWAGDARALDDLRPLPGALTPAASLELRLEVLNEVARILMLVDRAREAATIAEDGLALASEPATRQASRGRVDLLTTLGTCRFVLGHFSEGEETLAESARLALGERDAVGACRALHNVAFAVEDLNRMRDHAESGLAIAREHGLRPRERSFLIALSLCDAEAGDFAAAERHSDEAASITGPWEGLAHTRLDVGLPRAFLLVCRGDLHRARLEFTGVIERLGGARELGTWTAQRGLAVACLGDGDMDAARAALAPALAGNEPRGFDRVLALALLAEGTAGAGEADEVSGIADELAAVAPDHIGARASAVLVTALRGAPDAFAQVEEVARAHEERGRSMGASRWRLAGAEALARGGRPAEAADLAAAARERFVEVHAEEWCARAERLMRQLGRRVPAPSRGPGGAGLTARELEVLGLLADGLSNRAIAKRLVISEKTAGRHVANVYLKLGVHSRTQAVRTAIAQGLLPATPEAPAST
jgi:DNA-binding CsgD family transcriptional regulator